MLISAFTNALLKSQVVFVNINALNMNKQWTVFLLTNINKA